MKSSLAVVVALVAGVAACSKSRDPAPTAEPAVTPDVVLVSPGLEPRRVLRYHLVKGTTSTLELAMDLDLDAGGSGGKLPTLVMNLKITVEDVTPDGDARLETTVTGAQVRERDGSVVPVSAVAQMTDMLRGVTYSATLSPDGLLRDAKLTSATPAGMDKQIAQLTQGIEQVAIRMPSSPIGVGAKWTSRKTGKRNDLELTTMTTIELTQIEGDRVTFESSSAITAPDQTVQERGLTASIKDVGGGGHGKGTVDLSRMTMHGEVTAEFHGTMESQGKTAPLKMAMTLTMR